MNRCAICLKTFKKTEGKLITHLSGNKFFFCKPHIPNYKRKCEYCEKKIKLGEMATMGDAKGIIHIACRKCHKTMFPLDPYIVDEDIIAENAKRRLERAKKKAKKGKKK